MVSFGTVIRAEGNERIFRNTELSKTGTELAHGPIKCGYTTIVIEMKPAQLRVGIRIAFNIFLAGDTR